jgi:putative hydrolase of the HAD superfamily
MTPTIAFDADDTLWHNETSYAEAGAKLRRLLDGYQGDGQVERALGETEIRNLQRYGYGIKSFTLSMIEGAIDLSEGRISAGEIRQILEIGQEMLGAEVVLFEHAQETLAALAGSFQLMLITKGDLLEQENKIDRSGLAGYFRHIQVVRDKSAATYQQTLDRHDILPGHFLMVGNSLRSDILPVLEIGARAVYIPYEHTWDHEKPPDDQIPHRHFYELENLAGLPALAARLDWEEGS